MLLLSIDLKIERYISCKIYFLFTRVCSNEKPDGSINHDFNIYPKVIRVKIALQALVKDILLYFKLLEKLILSTKLENISAA